MTGLELIAVVERNPKDIPVEILLLLLLLGLIIFMWDLFDRRSVSFRKTSGLDDKSELISLRGGEFLPGKDLYSATLGLSSKPDALIKEDGFVIPVDIKPLSNKVRDRHIVAMMINLLLIEESAGVRPPYGILLLGKDKRRVKIKNSEEKQRWVAALLDEMRSIAGGVPAIPAPAPYKCRHCDVRDGCEHSLAKEEQRD